MRDLTALTTEQLISVLDSLGSSDSAFKTDIVAELSKPRCTRCGRAGRIVEHHHPVIVTDEGEVGVGYAALCRSCSGKISDSSENEKLDRGSV